MSGRYSGPQYLDANGFPIRRKPSESHFATEFRKKPLPNLRQNVTISPEAAKQIAEVFRMMLNS